MATHTPIMSAATTITPTSPRPSLSLDVQHPRPSISTLLPDRTHSQSSRRVSSESQRTSHGRASPSPRSTSRRTPVPALLDSFPIPPTTPVSPSIPGSFFGPSSSTPGPSGTHPPLTSPPPAPLPPVPGPSSVLLSDLLMTRRSLQMARPASPAGLDFFPPNTAYCAVTHERGQGGVIPEDPGVEGEHSSQCPPQSAPARALSPPASFFPLKPPVTLVPAIARPSASRKPSAGTSMPLSDNTYGEDSIREYRHERSKCAQFRSRSTSPELSQIISLTPRPRKRSRTSSLGRERALSVRSRKSSDALPPPVPKLSPTRTRTGWGNFGAQTGAVLGEDDDAYGSDSSIDLHTPLPHLMLRHGMLSPNSKLLPQPSVDSLNRMSMVSDVSNLSYFSNASNVSLASTSSKHPKDSRDTPRRRTRHRDGKLLKGGIGLTTGLGWSDSEDEDAPSPLTRRLSRIVLSRSTSASSFHSSRSSHSQPCLPHPLSRSISHSVLREADDPVADCIPSTIDEFGHSNGVTSRSLPSRSGSRAGTVSISRSGSTYSNYSTMSAPAAGLRMRTNSSSSSYEPVGRTNSYSRENGYGLHGLAVSIPEQDDGVTPTRAAFDRASLGAVKGGSGNGTQGGDQPHTPSSTTSSTSLSFPATPESTEGVQPQHIDDSKSGHGGEATPSAVAWNKDKSLPPLPYPAVATANSNSASSKGKYPPSLGLRAPSVIQRPRTYSNSSSVSTKSALAASNADGNTSRGPSPAPRNAPATPSAGGTSMPRPSLGIPRPSLSAISPASKSRPSLTLPSSAPISTATSPLATSPVTNGSMAGISQGQLPRPLRLVPSRSATPSSDPTRSQSPFLSRMPNRNVKKDLQPGEQLPRPGQILTYNRNVHDQLKLRSLSTSSGVSNAKIGPVSPGGTQTLLLTSQSETSGLGISPGSSPLSSPVTGESPKPKPRTGTGMTYRTNGTSRMRMPSTTSR
ncbi:hypothetical protein BKA82DRAFT_4168796 [Pisolithus tinctorius]|nr:hypothetical protein BKA82DRAFT_4168796 [Pisolithus tinctorius]